MKHFNKLASVALCAALVACGTAPTPTAITKYQNVIITLPKSMLTHCAITPPPSPAVYTNADPQTREQLLRANDAAQMLNIKNCNDKIDQANSWQDLNIKLYQPDPNSVWVGQSPAVPVSASGVTAVTPAK